jgi:hypothetical protein
MLCGDKEGWRGANYNSVGGRRLLETGSSGWVEFLYDQWNELN